MLFKMMRLCQYFPNVDALYLKLNNNLINKASLWIFLKFDFPKSSSDTKKRANLQGSTAAFPSFSVFFVLKCSSNHCIT